MELSFTRWNSKGPEKTKIVLLHGMGGTGALWRPVASGLEDHFSILAPDQRGHGSSRAEPGYTPLDYGKDVVETLERISFYPAWILGHSMGVRTACAVSYLKPEWTCGLILVDLALSGPAGGEVGESLIDFLTKFPARFSSRSAAKTFMEAECPDPAITQYLMAVSIKAPSGAITFPFDKSALIATLHAAKDVSVREWVNEFAERGKPVLFFRGMKSKAWSHEEFVSERERFKNYKNVKFEEVPDAGHGLPFEKRTFFVSRLKRFIAQSTLNPLVHH